MGWVLLDRLLLAWGLYFYLPPDLGAEGAATIPLRLPNTLILGTITVFGLISLLVRFFDAALDPWVARMSDNFSSRFGKRKPFMLFGAPLFAFSTLAFFMPPSPEASMMNAIYLAFVWLSFFVGFTFFVVPFTAWLSELPETSPLRMRLSIYKAYGQLIGGAVVMVGAPYLLQLFRNEYARIDTQSYQSAAIGIASLALALMVISIVATREKNTETSVASFGADNNAKALKNEDRVAASGPMIGWRALWSLSEMRLYIVASTSMWFGFNTVAVVAPYYVTVLMQKPEAAVGQVLALAFLTSAIVFPFIPRVARSLGRAKLLAFSSLAFALLLALLPYALQGSATSMLVFAALGLPMSVLLSVPNSMLSDLAHLLSVRFEQKLEASVFACQSFAMKANLGLSQMIVATCLAYGKSVTNPFGVVLTAWVGAGILLFSALVFFRIDRRAESWGEWCF